MEDILEFGSEWSFYKQAIVWRTWGLVRVGMDGGEKPFSLSKLCSLKGTGGERHSIHSPDCEAVVGGCGD